MPIRTEPRNPEGLARKLLRQEHVEWPGAYRPVRFHKPRQARNGIGDRVVGRGPGTIRRNTFGLHPLRPGRGEIRMGGEAGKDLQIRTSPGHRSGRDSL